MAEALAVGYAASLRAIQPHAMHLVEIGHGIMGVRHVTELRDRGDIAVHGVYRLESHQLRCMRIEIGQFAFEVTRVVVGKNARIASAMPNTFDHRGVIEFVGQDRAAWHVRGQCAQRGHVRHIAGRK